MVLISPLFHNWQQCPPKVFTALPWHLTWLMNLSFKCSAVASSWNSCPLAVYCQALCWLPYSINPGVPKAGPSPPHMLPSPGFFTHLRANDLWPSPHLCHSSPQGPGPSGCSQWVSPKDNFIFLTPVQDPIFSPTLYSLLSDLLQGMAEPSMQTPGIHTWLFPLKGSHKTLNPNTKYL